MVGQVPPEKFLCCDWSESINESMVGTAVKAAVWLMLEYNRPWKAQATEDNELPTAVQGWLAEQAAAVNGRVQFIRQSRPKDGMLTLMVGVNGAEGRLHAFRVGSYEALFDLDIKAVVAGAAEFEPHLVKEPHYFICVNGQRDRSCTVRGAALYQALQARVGTAVWHTTHLGGHRFAATLLSLPDGVCYGRVAASEADVLLQWSQQGQLWLPKLRGRSCYGAVEQVADYHVRQLTGETGLMAFRWLETAVLADESGYGRWQVTFAGAGQLYRVVVAGERPLEMYVNSDKLKTKAVKQYGLVEIRATAVG